MMTVYHGGTDIVSQPICAFGRQNLDFGQGFYVTDLREQAVNWALTIAQRRKAEPLINAYSFDRQGYLGEAKALVFPAYNRDWLNFIVDSRKGLHPWKDYDYVEGGIANDRVIDTINLYMEGLMDVDVALKRLAMHSPNNQICLLNQVLTDKYLIYNETQPAR